MDYELKPEETLFEIAFTRNGKEEKMIIAATMNLVFDFFMEPQKMDTINIKAIAGRNYNRQGLHYEEIQ